MTVSWGGRPPKCPICECYLDTGHVLCMIHRPHEYKGRTNSTFRYSAESPPLPIYGWESYAAGYPWWVNRDPYTYYV